MDWYSNLPNQFHSKRTKKLSDDIRVWDSSLWLCSGSEFNLGWIPVKLLGTKQQQFRKITLMRARLSKKDEATSGAKWKNMGKNQCKNKNGTCWYCNKLNTTGRIISTFTGREYQSKRNVTCKSSSVIYCIRCRICSEQYVGQTKKTLMQGLQSHWTDIEQTNPKTDVGRHFSTANGSGDR